MGEFRDRWRDDSTLQAEAADAAVVHLISGRAPAQDPNTLGIAFVAKACVTNWKAIAISWTTILDNRVDACKIALIMHENGHTFSLGHVDDPDANMYPYNRCQLNFLPSSRAGIKGYVEANAMTNLATAQYMLQAGVDLDTEIFIDKRQNPTGHSYTSNGAVSTLYEFRDRWRDDSTLQAEAAAH